MLYIHIGVHKTGTSTIQKFMSENTDLLARHGVLYPRIGRANNAHHNLVTEVRPDNSFFSSKTGGWASLRSEIADNGDKTIVISSEGFHTFGPKSVEAVRAATAGLDVGIICYIRDFAARWPSTYAERTKTGSNIADFDSYLSERGTNTTDSLERWGDVFGWSAVRIRSLDPRGLVDGNLLNDFIAAIGLRYADLAPELAVDNSLVRNLSPGWKTIELLRELHAASGGLRAKTGKRTDFKLTEAKKISAKIKSIGLEAGAQLGLNQERAQYLTPAQFELASETFSAVVRTLNEKLVDFQIPLPEPVDVPERPFLPEASRVPFEERAAFHRAVLFALVKELAGEGAETPTRRAAKRAELKAAEVAAPAAAAVATAPPETPDGDSLEKTRERRSERRQRRADKKAGKAGA